MISLLQRAEIRRLFYAEHWPVGTIADALGVHHETVQRAINRAHGIHPGPQIRPSRLDPYKAFIATTLEQYPRLRATRLYAMRRERGYPGSAVQVRRYVRIVFCGDRSPGRHHERPSSAGPSKTSMGGVRHVCFRASRHDRDDCGV